MKKITKIFLTVTILVFLVSFVAILISGDADKEGVLISLENAAIFSVVPLLVTILVQLLKKDELETGIFTIIVFGTVVLYLVSRMCSIWVAVALVLIELGIYIAVLVKKHKKQ